MIEQGMIEQGVIEEVRSMNQDESIRERDVKNPPGPFYERGSKDCSTNSGSKDHSSNAEADRGSFAVLVPFRITVLEDVDRSLKALAERMRKIRDIEAQAEASIERITTEKIEQAKPIREEILNLEAELSHYLEANKIDLFEGITYVDGCKSRKLNHGTVGYRQSTKIKAKKKTLSLCRSLGVTEPFFKQAIKVEEKLNKEAMKSWPDDKLGAVEAKKETMDVPYYETKEFNIKEL